MIDPQHKSLASGRWWEMSLIEQMANIGSEAERSMKWQRVGNHENFQKALERFIELMILTLEDPNNRLRLKELCRVKELFLDFLAGDNKYRQTYTQWQKYFWVFTYAVRRDR
jgi:hypothetical protein